MNQTAFQESMKRILAFYGKGDAEDQKAYMRSTYEGIAWMDPYQFDETCKVVATEASPMKRPMLGQFIGTFKRLKEERKWGKEHDPQRTIGFTPEEHHSWMLQEVESMSAQGARVVLERCPELFPEGIVKALLERAAVRETSADASEFVEAEDVPSTLAPVGGATTIADEWEAAE